MSEEHLLGQKVASCLGETTESGFRAEIMEASLKRPILVVFWSSKNPATRTILSSMGKLQKLAGDSAGFFSFDTEANPRLSAQLVQIGLPLNRLPLTAVFYRAQILNVLPGDKSPVELRRFLENILREAGQNLPGTLLLEQAEKALKEDRADEAVGFYSQLLESEPENPQGWGGLIRGLLALDELEAAKDALAEVPESLRGLPEIQSAMDALKLRETSAQAAKGLEKLETERQKNPEDNALLLKLALALNGAGQKEAAADALLEIIKRAPDWREGAARAELLRFFEAWGFSDPATLKARRKLSSLLFS